MDTKTLPTLPVFFFERLDYDISTLRVLLSVEGRTAVEVTFASPRAFRTFSESDYWHYLKDFEGRSVISSTESGCDILLSETAPYLTDYRENVREPKDEETFSCLIMTPQECVEVICFAEPKILMV